MATDKEALKQYLETYSSIKKGSEANLIKLVNALIAAVNKAKADLDKRVDSAVDSALTLLSKKVDARLATVRDGYTPVKGKDYFDGAPGDKGDKGDTIVGPPGEPGKDGSPDMAEDIRNKLELLDGDERLKIEAIRDLREELDKLKKQTGKLVSGGGGQMDVSHWARHEAFTMNGSDTSVTLSVGVGAQGNAIIVRYQGQTLDMTTHYTVSGNQVSLVDITPNSGDIISVTYWP